MAPIPEPKETTVSRIFKSWEDNANNRHSRRLGASQIGRSCEREIWYSFRWAKKQQWLGRMLRLFARGQIEESCVGSDLQGIGVDFHPLDDETGKQYEFSELGDHFVCKLDGAASGFVEAPETFHVVEIKTANQKKFDAISKDGIKKAKPEHYAQVQTGMGMSGMERAAYICVNKNDDDIYFERVTFDKKEWNRILQRAKEIIFATEPPDKINESPAWFQCKFCNYSGICHECGEVAEKNCRTCGFSTPLEAGGWSCDNDNTVIDDEKQKVGCEEHCYRSGMVPAVVDKVLGTLGGKIVMDPDSLSV